MVVQNYQIYHLNLINNILILLIKKIYFYLNLLFPNLSIIFNFIIYLKYILLFSYLIHLNNLYLNNI